MGAGTVGATQSTHTRAKPAWGGLCSKSAGDAGDGYTEFGGDIEPNVVRGTVSKALLQRKDKFTLNVPKCIQTDPTTWKPPQERCCANQHEPQSGQQVYRYA